MSVKRGRVHGGHTGAKVLVNFRLTCGMPGGAPWPSENLGKA